MLNFIGDTHQMTWVISGLFFLIIYYYIIMILVGSILENAKVKGVWQLVLAIFNTAISCFFITSVKITSLYFYIFLFFLFLMEFYFLYKDSLIRVLFVTCSCMIHVMTMRAICVGVLSILLDISFFAVTNNMNSFWISTVITIFILDIAVVLVIKFVSNTKLKIIVQHKEQLNFFVTWEMINMLYMVFNAVTYSIDQPYYLLSEIQIITSVAVLVSTYIILFYFFKTSTLLGYKHKNVELEREMQREQQFRESVLTESIASYEFNVSKNEIISGFDDLIALMDDQTDISYNQMLITMAQRFVHSDDLISFIDQANVEKIMEGFNKGRSEASIEYRRRVPSGEYVWVRSITNLVREISSGDIKAFTYVRDIDKEKKERILLEYNAQKDALTGLYNKSMTTKLVTDYLNNSTDFNGSGVLFMIDIDNFKSINDSLGHIYGDAVLRELSEKLTKCFKIDDIVGRVGGDEFMAFIKGNYHKKNIEEKADEICKSLYNIYQGSGKTEHVISGSVGIAIAPHNGDNFEELFKKADIALYMSKNKGKNTYSIYEGEKFIEYKSTREDYDDITGSISFKQFKKKAVDILAKSEDEKYVFIIVDVNDFKAINGIYGFDEGDQILKVMAKSIAMTIGDAGIFARMSNDKFAVLTSYSEELGIYRQGEQFRQNFYDMGSKEAQSYNVTFSIGYNIIATGDTEILEIIEKTMVAHSTAKRSEVGMVCYSEILKENEKKQETIEKNMYTALENGEFVFLLQPKYQLQSGKIMGAEALVRWADSVGMLVPPCEFLHIFELNGFIVQLDLFVFEQVCKLQKIYLDKGFTPVPISVNHSRLLIKMTGYVKKLTAIAKQHGVSPTLIGLEFADNVDFTDIEEMKNIVKALKNEGFIVAVDNFGQRYSSVGMLQELTADILKIDREFLRKAQLDTRGKVVLSGMMRMAKELSMSVVAVGLETQEQAELMTIQDGDLVQGYLYAKPITATEFEKICYN